MTIIRLTVVTAIMTAALWADSITVSVTSNSSSLGQSFPIGVYEFNPSLGTLDDVEWSLSVGQDVVIDIGNGCVANPPLISYAYSVTTGTSIFGSSGSYTGTGSGTTYGSCVGFYGDPNYDAHFVLSGTLTTDLSQFIGSGVTDATVTPFIESETGSGFADIYSEGAYLTVTYDYTPAIPEPTTLPLTLLAVGALFSFRRWRKA